MMKRLKLVFLVFCQLMLLTSQIRGQETAGPEAFDKVVIDAGHGGHDPGALGSRSKEKDITLSIALLAGDMIRKKLPGVEVIYTRSTDRFVELHQRAELANQNKADLFISIHCNSNSSPQPYGAETYVMGLHKTQENLEVAKTENAAILMEDDYNEHYDGFDPNSDEDYIMLNMVQSAHIEQSIDFSVLTQEKLHSTGGLRNRGVRQAGFVVLYLTTMPGVLIETGFLSNKKEEAFLMKKNNQQAIATAICEAVAGYKQSFEQVVASSLQLPAKQDSLNTPKKVNTCYRIWFDSFKQPKPRSHRKFRAMSKLWYFYDGKKYQYTFGQSDSLSTIVDYLKQCRDLKQIKKQYLKNARILKFEDGRLVSDIPLKRN